jgi:hypothetical protein
MSPEAVKSRGGYRTYAHHRRKQERRRAHLKELGVCINGPTHGKATHGCRCKACYLVHRGDAKNLSQAHYLILVSKP